MPLLEYKCYADITRHQQSETVKKLAPMFYGKSMEFCTQMPPGKAGIEPHEYMPCLHLLLPRILTRIGTLFCHHRVVPCAVSAMHSAMPNSRKAR